MKNAQLVTELSAPSKADSNTADVSGHAQRRRIGARLLKHGSATTIELRDLCNAMCPAPRIFEMRRLGWCIATVRERVIDAQGREHNCARYVLQRPGGAA